ncbi:MAG: phosphate starvation-inducible protein PhoH [Alphaproteobacteria bacterium 32-64-14]|nr:MAG: phosphate starvation-inducible protein PhoH [Alphaproteobacteria bacterium 32-64-14]
MSTKPKSPRANRFVVPVASQQMLRDLCGPAHVHLQMLEQAFADDGVRIDSQGQSGEIIVTGDGDGARRAADALKAFARRIANGAEATAAELEAAIRLTADSESAGAPADAIMGLRKPVMAQTPGQRAYLEKLQRDDHGLIFGQRAYLEKLQRDDHGLIFGVGPAGTGKTYLAVAVGAAELKAGKRERLIVARPAVEAGEKLGFLPGALEEKVDPYMLPIWDALNECLGAQEVDRRKERKEIEVAPLAFMRGRTLKNAFVIIDEAQNATVPQMKMVLTRLGRASRMVVTGDPSQTDLPNGVKSGLGHAMSILRGVKGVAIEELTRADVVRHELVGRIIEAYDNDASKGASRK